MGKKTIILVRHGQYHSAKEGGEERLTTLGRRQARYVAKRLKEEKIDKIIYSTMPRAKETAKLIVQDLNYHGSIDSCELLRECTPKLPAKVAKKMGYKDKKYLEKSQKQIERAFKKYFKTSREDSVVVLVCHGNVIRYLMCRALGIDTMNWVKLDILQCSISSVLVKSKGIHRSAVISHNDVGHIPKKHRTFL